MTKIGLYGGSFDPVHLGHLLVAQAALEEVGLAKVCFIPAAQSPFKQDSRPASDALRLQMLRLALAGNPSFVVDAQEIERGGISYTIETVREYTRKYPACELYCLIGADHARQLPEWHEAGELAAAARFIVLPRPGQEDLPLTPPFQGCVLKGFPLSLSSSQIRDRVRRGLSIDYLVPPAVADVIHNNGLYL